MPSMAGQTFQGSAVAATSLEEVWAKFDDPGTWEGIAGVDRVYDELRDPNGRLAGFKFDSTAVGKTYLGKATPGPRHEREILTWDIKTSEIRGKIIVKTEESGGGTRISVVLEVQPISMMASIGFPLIAGTISRGFQETVDDFAACLMTKT